MSCRCDEIFLGQGNLKYRFKSGRAEIYPHVIDTYHLGAARVLLEKTTGLLSVKRKMSEDSPFQKL